VGWVLVAGMVLLVLCIYQVKNPMCPWCLRRNIVESKYPGAVTGHTHRCVTVGCRWSGMRSDL